jgi:hypothetical protein
MTPVPPEWLSWADFLAKCGQFLFGFSTLALALWAAIFKRKELFRTELVKKQLDELGKVRTALQSIFFDFYYIPSTEEMMRTMGWNLDALKEHAPESWEQYQRYKNTSLELFYKFSDSNYYLFPEWIDKEKRESFSEAMKAFAPFTLVATAAKTPSERETYAVEIAKMKEYFDGALQTHA